MKCPNCGKEIANDSQFCEFCGTPVKTRTNSHKWIWMTLAIFVCVSIFCVLLYQEHTAKIEALAEAQAIKEQAEAEATKAKAEAETHEKAESSNEGKEHKETPKEDENVIQPGETWSYTEHSSFGDVTTYFVFTSKTEVTWLFGTPFGNFFPVGFGKYNASTGDVTFSSSNKLHNKISLYYGVQAIVFHIDRIKRTARCKYEDINRFYNSGNEFSIAREKRKLMPSKKLVGSKWKTEDGEYEIYFKTVNEALLRYTPAPEGDSRPMAYVCIGNMIAIKSGDNIDDENLIGNIVNGNEATICREGLSSERGSWCMSIHKQ